jgi:hypothetical protein
MCLVASSFGAALADAWIWGMPSIGATALVTTSGRMLRGLWYPTRL